MGWFASKADENVCIARKYWCQVAQDEIDTIGGWRNAPDKLDPWPETTALTTTTPIRRWSGPGNDFWSDTRRLLDFVISELPGVSPQPLLDIQDAIGKWHADRNADRLPSQNALWAMFDHAVLVLYAIDAKIHGRILSAEAPVVAVDPKTRVVVVNGMRHADVQPHHVKMIKAVVDADGDYVPGPTLGVNGKNISREWKNIFQKMPMLKHLIVSEKPKGYRLRKST